jgi:predicted metal-dependent peptidase
MAPATKQTAEDPQLRRRIDDGLRLVTVPFPHFAGLARLIRVTLDERVPTMGVFASGRLLVNPSFVRQLNDNELVFVLAHEIFHLALRTHERAVGSDPLQFNYAHDYIINDILRGELGFEHVPAGGLDWPGARQMSAEEILLQMDKNPNHVARCTGGVWRLRSDGAGQESGPQGDVLDGRLEREWFSDEDPSEQEARAETVRETAAKGLSLGKMMGAIKGAGRGTDSAAANQLVDALRGLYRTPWEMALQRWLESVAPGPRTFVRPSRRGAERTDVVLPGRKREGWILNIVLDTSGSMSDELPWALGAIADFCDAVAVDQVRLLQCDVSVTSDRFLTPDELARCEISGYGGSDLSPAMLLLADDPHVEAVMVLTDGEIAYPQGEMPYDVLWVLPAHASPTFRPGYGVVIHMQESGIRSQGSGVRSQ